MQWLHTWAGVTLGALLFAIFWTGTLSVFDREIDRWMAPATRLALPGTPRDLEALRPLLDRAAAAGAARWVVAQPTEREPVTRVSWREASGAVSHLLDPATGAALTDPGTWGGTRFLYPFHYMLHIAPWRLGGWLVGLASMAMLVLCVSGTIVHRRIFADFFTLRLDRKRRRSILDLHNATGVLALPFHVVITLSGLIVLYPTYFASAWQVAYDGDQRAFFKQAYDNFERPKLGRPAAMASLDAMVEEARRLWDGDGARSTVVQHPGDAAAYVQINRSNEGHVGRGNDWATFDGPTGKLLHQRDTQPVLAAQHFIVGLHLIQFRHASLRWLYFGLGLAGCIMIATGCLFWLEARRRRHARLGLRGVAMVEGLTIGSVTGILIATLAFFVANRVLPPGARFLGEERAALEAWAFYGVWLVAFAHAWLRPGRAWREQCRAIAALAIAAVLLNWITTGDHLCRSLAHRHLWAVAGMDVLLLAGAAIAARACGAARRP